MTCFVPECSWVLKTKYKYWHIYSLFWSVGPHQWNNHWTEPFERSHGYHKYTPFSNGLDPARSLDFFNYNVSYNLVQPLKTEKIINMHSDLSVLSSVLLGFIWDLHSAVLWNNSTPSAAPFSDLTDGPSLLEAYLNPRWPGHPSVTPGSNLSIRKNDFHSAVWDFQNMPMQKCHMCKYRNMSGWD